jgi:PleD family two-component response regulator
MARRAGENVDAVANETAKRAVKDSIPAERSVLIVEDDHSFLQRLAKALEQRGFIVTTAESVADGLLQVATAMGSMLYPPSSTGARTRAASSLPAMATSPPRLMR